MRRRRNSTSFRRLRAPKLKNRCKKEYRRGRSFFQSLQMDTRGLSPELYLCRSHSVNCASQNNDIESVKERPMDILAAIQLAATAALLIVHLTIVVRNRFATRR